MTRSNLRSVCSGAGSATNIFHQRVQRIAESFGRRERLPVLSSTRPAARPASSNSAPSGSPKSYDPSPSSSSASDRRKTMAHSDLLRVCCTADARLATSTFHLRSQQIAQKAMTHPDLLPVCSGAGLASNVFHQRAQGIGQKPSPAANGSLSAPSPDAQPAPSISAPSRSPKSHDAPRFAPRLLPRRNPLRNQHRPSLHPANRQNAMTRSNLLSVCSGADSATSIFHHNAQGTAPKL